MTTLPLFWDLSASSKNERINASAKLVSALQQFQNQFVALKTGRASDPTGEAEETANEVDLLESANAQDVAYSVRRLIRGLASSREQSRLGFAVVLTEVRDR
jgi:DNA polymerase phi